MMNCLSMGLLLAIGQLQPPAVPDAATAPKAPGAGKSLPAVVEVQANDEEKTKEQLIQELEVLRKRLAAIEVLDKAPEEKKDEKADGDKKNGNGDKKEEKADGKNGNGDKKENGNGDKKKEDDRPFLKCFSDKDKHYGFFGTIAKSYWEEFWPDPNAEDAPAVEKDRRSPPDPWESPPFPTHEYQGYPIIGSPPDDSTYPLMKGIYALPFGDAIKATGIKLEGWATGGGNWSTAKFTNSPESYWLVPNRYELDQLVFRLHRELDSVQTDHIDWGFRSTALYGQDYRYMAAGGWFGEQLFRENKLYGWDPTEQYLDIYFPHIAQGMVWRIGRWIACPDIETQFSTDNYLATHSILFTFDTYTQTGTMFTFMLNKQWIVQGGMNAGDDMAPWYKGAVPCGYGAVRWVSKSNLDAVYAVINQIDSAEFRHFDEHGQPSGHDNYNYFVATWEHCFDEKGRFHTATESYFMWQRDAVLGGTPSEGAPQSFGGGGGIGATIPGITYTYGVLNYTELYLSKKSYLCFRNEYWHDDKGMRSGFPGVYTSNTVGISHYFNSYLLVRPEIGYYRNWTNPAFDLGASHGITQYGLDVTLRF